MTIGNQSVNILGQTGNSPILEGMGIRKPTVRPKKQKNIDGKALALEALEQLAPEVRERILKDVAKKNPEMAKALTEGAWSLETLVEMPHQDFKFLWWEIDRATWLLALRGASPKLLAFILKNLTERAGKQLEEDLKAKGPQPAARVHEAQAAIMYQVREAISQKKINDFRNSQKIAKKGA
ncbi:MAG TPA: FliG C-terminal domain-containing protein [Pseudobdellovibrionaceae bacterium]|nr:FliG C-terminal domain-containing protein [Pseudobdellovibrionaceae bacterium]